MLQQLLNFINVNKNKMKISELPQEIRELALKYQRDEKDDRNFSKKTDELSDAFNWTNTPQGINFWSDWSLKKTSEKPTQYQIGIDTFERAEANMTKEEIIACCKFNIDKYNWRKKGQDIEDFKKIIDYANFAIKQLEK